MKSVGWVCIRHGLRRDDYLGTVGIDQLCRADHSLRLRGDNGARLGVRLLGRGEDFLIDRVEVVAGVGDDKGHGVSPDSDFGQK